MNPPDRGSTSSRYDHSHFGHILIHGPNFDCPCSGLGKIEQRPRFLLGFLIGPPSITQPYTRRSGAMMLPKRNRDHGLFHAIKHHWLYPSLACESTTRSISANTGTEKANLRHPSVCQGPTILFWPVTTGGNPAFWIIASHFRFQHGGLLPI